MPKNQMKKLSWWFDGRAQAFPPTWGWTIIMGITVVIALFVFAINASK